MSAPGATGVLVMAYGTPASLEDLPAFYTEVRRGRPPTDEQLKELEGRYRAIGGVSPLTARSAAQVAALTGALEGLAPGRFRVRYGTKHAEPTLEAAVAGLADEGVTAVVGLVLAPHYSPMSVGEYHERVEKAAGGRFLRCRFVRSWHDDPVLVALLAERVASGLASLAERGARRPEVVFTAHSLPARSLALGDRYGDDLAETARLVATAAGLSSHRVAFQSAGRTPEPWLGPDLLSTLATCAEEGFDAVLVCPAGFTSDHLEVLYDLDIEAKARAGELSLSFERTASLNDDARLFSALARRVVDALDAPA